MQGELIQSPGVLSIRDSVRPLMQIWRLSAVQTYAYWIPIIIPWYRILTWEADIRSDDQEIPYFYGNRGFHHVHKTPQLRSILSQLNPVYTRTPQSYMMHFNTKIQSKFWSSKWSLPLSFRLNPVFINSSISVICPSVILLHQCQPKVQTKEFFIT
jgi:hypothetical protein